MVVLKNFKRFGYVRSLRFKYRVKVKGSLPGNVPFSDKPPIPSQPSWRNLVRKQFIFSFVNISVCFAKLVDFRL